MVVCSYFLRGTCKFGTNCRNEHPQGEQRQGGFGNNSWTNSNRDATDSKLPFAMESMGQDLTPHKDKPLWPLSCYGPAKYEPNLISGLDESQEELRVRAVTANQSQKMVEYMNYEQETIAVAEQNYVNARNNLSQVFERAVMQSPLNSGAASNPSGMISAFGTPTSTSASAFGNPTSTSTFGKSTFGTATSTSAFGNQTTTSAFGNTASAFGKPAFSQPAFGQSAFSQVATPASAFGQPTSAFGQFGQTQALHTQNTPSAFGQQQPSTSAFGQPPQPSSFIKPASGAFGLLNSSSSSNAFSAFSGQPAAFGSGAPTTTTTTAAPTTQPVSGGSVFGQPSIGATAANQSTSAFGASAPSTTPAFGAPSAFGALTQQPTTSVFGHSPFGVNSSSTVSAFNSQATPLGNPLNNTTPSPFAPTSSPSAFPTASPMQSALSQAPLSAFPMASPTVSMGFNVAAQPPPLNATTSTTKGPPDFSQVKSLYKPGLTPYDQILPPDYIKRIPESALEAFQNQKLEWDNIPDWIPPIELR